MVKGKKSRKRIGFKKKKKIGKLPKRNSKAVGKNSVVDELNNETSINIVKNKENDNEMNEENTKDYYKRVINNTFDTYGALILERYLSEETNPEKRNVITEKILNLFGLNKEVRKLTLKYLSKKLDEYKISPKFYFKSVSIFDTFLIKYSEKNDIETCSKFFFSKNTKEFSQTKLNIFCLCCFYLSNQLLNTKCFDLKCFVNWGGENEFTYEDLINLVDDILTYIECDTNIISLYDYIEIFMFDLSKRLKILTKEKNFIEFYYNKVIFLAVKIIQDISILNILPSTQAIAVVAFAYDYSKYLKNFLDKDIDYFVGKWEENARISLINSENEDIKNVIKWLNDYVSSHF